MDRFKWQFNKTGLEIFPSNYFRYVVLVTDKCNLSCSYCFQHYDRNKNQAMTKEVAEKYIDGVFENPPSEFKTIFFQFCGGEALLEPEIISHSIKYAKNKELPKDKKLSFGVLSNGVLVNTEPVKKLFAEHPDLRIQISLDGHKEIHNKHRGNFDETVNGIRWLQENNINVSCAMTVSPDNVEYFSSGFRFIAEELAIQNIWISITVDDERWDINENVEKLYSELRKVVNIMTEPHLAEKVWTNLFSPLEFLPINEHNYVCSTYRYQLTCTPTGELFSCYVTRNQNKVDMSVGNINDWITKYDDIAKMTLKNYDGVEECRKCLIGSGCKKCIGHFAERYDKLFKGNDINCKVHHAKYYAFLYLIEKRRNIIGNETMLVHS